MPQPDHVSALPVGDPETLDEDLRALFALCIEKLGIVPNVLRAYSLRPQKLRNLVAMYNELMLAPSGLTKLEREMVAVVVSSANRCYYCLVAHGQAVRRLSGDPELGEMLVMNYRVAPLEPRHRAMLDFAWKLTTAPATIGERTAPACARRVSAMKRFSTSPTPSPSSTCRTGWRAVWISFQITNITAGIAEPARRDQLTDRECGV